MLGNTLLIISRRDNMINNCTFVPLTFFNVFIYYCHNTAVVITDIATWCFASSERFPREQNSTPSYVSYLASQG